MNLIKYKERMVRQLMHSIEKKTSDLSIKQLRVIREHLNYAFVAGYEYLPYSQNDKERAVAQFKGDELVAVYSTVRKAIQMSGFGTFHIFASLQKGVTYDDTYFVYLDQLK